MQIFTKLYQVVSRFLGTPIIVVPEAPVETSTVEPIIMPLEPIADSHAEISFERLSNLEKYRQMTEILEDMFTQIRWDEEGSILDSRSDFPFCDSDIPLDALTCEVMEVQQDTPVIFRGEVMRIKRSLRRMQDCLNAKRSFASPFAKRFESVLKELTEKTLIIEEAIKVLDNLTRVTDDCASTYRHEDILVQMCKEPKGYSKLCKGKCRNNKCESTEDSPQTEPKKD